MTYPHTAAPRHFAGELIAKQVDSCAGLHRMELRLVDNDASHVHVVYLAYGRGDAAARYAQAQFDSLTLGCWYHSSATLARKTTGKTEWAGHVEPLQMCQRRHRFSQVSHTVQVAA
jgi:hypothetical protein